MKFHQLEEGQIIEFIDVPNGMSWLNISTIFGQTWLVFYKDDNKIRIKKTPSDSFTVTKEEFSNMTVIISEAVRTKKAMKRRKHEISSQIPAPQGRKTAILPNGLWRFDK